MEGRTRVTLTGDGGVRQVVDGTEVMRQGNTMRVLRGCGWTTSGTRSCIAGDSTAVAGILADADQRYAIAAQSMIVGAGHERAAERLHGRRPDESGDRDARTGLPLPPVHGCGGSRRDGTTPAPGSDRVTSNSR